VVSHKKLTVKNNHFPYADCKLHRVQRRRRKTEQRSEGIIRKRNKLKRKD